MFIWPEFRMVKCRDDVHKEDALNVIRLVARLENFVRLISNDNRYIEKLAFGLWKPFANNWAILMSELKRLESYLIK